MDVAEILSAIDIDDDRRVQRWRVGIIPEKNLLTVALEGDFDEVSHRLLCPRAETEKLLPATPHQLLRAHLAELFQMLVHGSLERFRSGLVIGVRSALRLGNHLVDHLQLKQLGGSDSQSRRRLFAPLRTLGILPENCRASLD